MPIKAQLHSVIVEVPFAVDASLNVVEKGEQPLVSSALKSAVGFSKTVIVSWSIVSPIVSVRVTV